MYQYVSDEFVLNCTHTGCTRVRSTRADLSADPIDSVSSAFSSSVLGNAPVRKISLEPQPLEKTERDPKSKSEALKNARRTLVRASAKTERKACIFTLSSLISNHFSSPPPPSCARTPRILRHSFFERSNFFGTRWTQCASRDLEAPLHSTAGPQQGAKSEAKRTAWRGARSRRRRLQAPAVFAESITI